MEYSGWLKAEGDDGFKTHISSFYITTCDALSYHLSCIGVEGSICFYSWDISCNN